MPFPPPHAPPSIALLRDLSLKVQLDSALEDALVAFVADESDAADAKAYLARALALTERCAAFLDAETSRLTQARFAGGDANALKQRLLLDPRKQVDAAVMQLKQRLAGERAEWSRRVAKQLLDVQAAHEDQLASLEVTESPDGSEMIVTPSAAWLARYMTWYAETFRRWTAHLAELVRAKTTQLLQPDLDLITSLLGGRVEVVFPMQDALPVPPVRFEVEGRAPTGRITRRSESAATEKLVDRFEVPSTAAATFESFKGGLNTVAMLAGMVVIPVVGTLMNAAPTAMKAAIMGGMIAPIVGFAVWAGRRSRTRLVAVNRDKARDRLRKALAGELKSTLDRFKMEAERFCQSYLQSAQQVALAAIEPAVQREFEKRDQAAVQELAKSQLASDKIAEQLMAVKQVKTGLTGQLIVDLKRKLALG